MSEDINAPTTNLLGGSLAGKFWDLFAGIPINPVLRERLQLALDQREALEKLVAELKESLRACQAEVAGLRAELASIDRERAAASEQEALSSQQKYVEHYGVLWKRDGKGGYEPVPYCPECKRGMNAFQEVFPFECGKCHQEAPFTGLELKRVMEGLPK